MNLRMLSGVKSFELAMKEHALCLCFQVTVQKYNQSAGQFPRHIKSLLKLCCVELGRVFCFTRKGHGGSG